MTFESIALFFHHPQIHLTCEQAVCYIVWRLLQGDIHYSGLIREIEESSTGYRLSPTVALTALKYLEESKLVQSTRQKVAVGRGRPRRVYQLLPEVREIAHEYVDLWLKSPYATAIHPHCKSAY